MIFINLPKEDWDLILDCINQRLSFLDQENHFFLEEPGTLNYELIEIRDYILSFTNPLESIE